MQPQMPIEGGASPSRAYIDVDPTHLATPGVYTTPFHRFIDEPLPPFDRRRLFDWASVSPPATPPSGSVDDLADFFGINPDEIYEYVRMRLEDIDGQIRDLQGDANDRKKRSEELRTFQQAVRSLVGVGGDGGRYDSTKGGGNQGELNAAAGKRLDQAIRELAGNPNLVARLEALKSHIFQDGPYGSQIGAEQLQNELDYAKDQLTAINSGNELTMMRLNTLFQLRNQVITSGSNEQASINDGIKAIINNMRA